MSGSYSPGGVGTTRLFCEDLGHQTVSTPNLDVVAVAVVASILTGGFVVLRLTFGTSAALQCLFQLLSLVNRQRSYPASCSRRRSSSCRSVVSVPMPATPGIGSGFVGALR